MEKAFKKLKRTKRKRLSLPSSLKNEILRIILNQKNARRIILFGSRARGDALPTSDIDLAIADENWSDTDINLAKHALEAELRTPLKIDLVNLFTVAKPQFKAMILKEGRLIYESGKNKKSH